MESEPCLALWKSKTMGVYNSSNNQDSSSQNIQNAGSEGVGARDRSLPYPKAATGSWTRAYWSSAQLLILTSWVTALLAAAVNVKVKLESLKTFFVEAKATFFLLKNGYYQAAKVKVSERETKLGLEGQNWLVFFPFWKAHDVENAELIYEDMQTVKLVSITNFLQRTVNK